MRFVVTICLMLVPFTGIASEFRDSVRGEVVSIVKHRFPDEPPEKIESAATVILQTLDPFLEREGLTELEPYLREAALIDAGRLTSDFFGNFGSDSNALIFQRMIEFSQDSVDYLEGIQVNEYLDSIDTMRADFIALKERIDKEIVSELQRREVLSLPEELLPTEVIGFIQFVKSSREILGDEADRMITSTLDNYFVIVRAEASEIIWNELNATALDVRYAGRFLRSRKEFADSGRDIEDKVILYVGQRMRAFSSLPLLENYVQIHLPLLTHSVGIENYPKGYSTSKDPFPQGLPEVRWIAPLSTR